MRHVAGVILAGAFGALALSLAGTAVAQADEGAPELLILENGVTGLMGNLRGGAASIATLGGKELDGTNVELKIKGCKNGASEKDTTLCEAVLTITGWKEGKVACRSENAKGEKDPVETVLNVFDVHLASEEASGGSGELEPLALFKFLGQSGNEGELIIVCGGVKKKIKGVLPCLLLPGLEEVPTTKEAEDTCKQSKTSRDQETGRCVMLCEWITEFPFEANLGNGFEDAGANLAAKGTFNKDVLIDD
jgi:hypothetical protein